MNNRSAAFDAINVIIMTKKPDIKPKDLKGLPDDFLLSDLGFDSIDSVELEMEIERELKCDVNASHVLKTYGQLVNAYQQHMN